MNAFRLTLDPSTGGPPPLPRVDSERPRIYDPYSLATRPLPNCLRLYPHPKGIDAAAARRITAGAVC